MIARYPTKIARCKVQGARYLTHPAHLTTDSCTGLESIDLFIIGVFKFFYTGQLCVPSIDSFERCFGNNVGKKAGAQVYTCTTVKLPLTTAFLNT
tara:strand:- start:638 stop:922 length:285 start_codon:yes stop_codon:yes gene_type:complete